MHLPKIAVQLASLRLPLKQALGAASRLGARGVEIDARHEVRPAELSQTGLRQLRKFLEDLRLVVCAVNFPLRRGFDVEQHLEQRIDAARAAMRLAHQLGTPLLVSPLGDLSADPHSPNSHSFRDVILGLANYGDHVGARLVASTGRASGQDIARWIAALPEGSLGADLDPAALIMHGFSPREAIAALGPNILHVHASDAVERSGLMHSAEVALGRGTADIPALLAALEEHAYHGWITIARHGANDPQTEIGNAVQYLLNLWG
jgi:sugar phosphate isomerase/epimerase